MVNFYGTLVLLFPFLGFLWLIAVPYVLTSWQNMEGSFETSGLQFVYVLKSFILLFALGLTLQGIALAIRSFHVLKNRKG